jgi:AMMECR1 domain-containing protein
VGAHNGVASDDENVISTAQQAACPAVAPVEAKGELVEVGVEVPVGDRPVMGAEPPTVQVRGHHVGSNSLPVRPDRLMFTCLWA